LKNKKTGEKWHILKEKYQKQEGTKEELTSKQLPLKLADVPPLEKLTCTTVLTGMKANYITEVRF
jgi:hypothetical protein